MGATSSAGMASSVATIGLILSLAQQGLLPLDGALPVVLGANIGTCATALAASLRSSADARRVAVAHIAFKVLGVALVFPFIQPLTALVATTAEPARQIANAHTPLQRGHQRALPALRPSGRAGHHRARARGESAETIPSRRATWTIAISTSRPSRSARPPAKRSAWATWRRVCCAMP